MKAMSKKPHFSYVKQVATNQICFKHGIRKIKVLGFVDCRACMTEIVQRSQREYDQRINQKVTDKHMLTGMIPSRYKDCGFNNYHIVNKGQEIAKQASVDFVKSVIDKQVKNLIVIGRTGTGKTHLAAAVIRNTLKKGLYARYIRSVDLATAISNAWTSNDDNESSAIYRFVDYDLLVIDEYGLHDRFENRLELIHKVIYTRYDLKKCTVIISNFTEELLKKDLGDRIWSRFHHDGVNIVTCNWSDWRTSEEFNVLKQQQVLSKVN